MENANTTIVTARRRRKAKMSNERSEQQLVDVFEVNIMPDDIVPPVPLSNPRDLEPQKEVESNREHPCAKEKG